jgi:hypothetical protein
MNQDEKNADASRKAIYWEKLDSDTLARVYELNWIPSIGQVEVRYDKHHWQSKSIEEWRVIGKLAIPQMEAQAMRWKRQRGRCYAELASLALQIKSKETRGYWASWTRTLRAAIDRAINANDHASGMGDVVRARVREEWLVRDAHERLFATVALQQQP